MLDEPSLGLAPVVVENVLEALEKVIQRNISILLVEQIVFHAIDLANRCYLLEKGRLALERTHEEFERNEKIEKYIFRKTFESDLPTEVVWRLKAEFSQGSGSAGLLPDYFEQHVDDVEFNAAQASHSMIRSKEEYYYFKIFKKYFGEGSAANTVGQWITL